MPAKKIPVEVSAKHVHLSKEDLGKLFGVEVQLKKLKDLTQPGEFAAYQTVDVQLGKKLISQVRIVGPERRESQVELALTDIHGSEVSVPVKESGELLGTPGATLIGPRGKAVLEKGVIVAERHIHCNPEEAFGLGIKVGQLVSVVIDSPRPLIFQNVKVRVRDDYKLCMHLDTDEGNAAGIDRRTEGVITDDKIFKL